MNERVDKEKFVQKFKALYEAKNRKLISDNEASELFENLITLVDSIYQPIRKNHGHSE